MNALRRSQSNRRQNQRNRIAKEITTSGHAAVVVEYLKVNNVVFSARELSNTQV